MTTWFTLRGAAEYVSVSQEIIRAAVKSGDLPAYAIGRGRDYRLTADDIDDWMRSRSYEPHQLDRLDQRRGRQHERVAAEDRHPCRFTRTLRITGLDSAG
ncbi:hypothetical protein AWC11_07645 [Mycobacterium interjectum]|nr:hypothetical protein AWC11_07645 [Mycobacterium interjectum]